MTLSARVFGPALMTVEHRQARAIRRVQVLSGLAVVANLGAVAFQVATAARWRWAFLPLHLIGIAAVAIAYWRAKHATDLAGPFPPVGRIRCVAGARLPALYPGECAEVELAPQRTADGLVLVATGYLVSPAPGWWAAWHRQRYRLELRGARLLGP